jgi:hypothetical protein
MPMPGDVRFMPSQTTQRFRTPEALPPWQRAARSLPNMRESISSRVAPFTPGNGAARMVPGPGRSPSAPLFDRVPQAISAAHTNGVSAQTSRLAPFDTVYQTGWNGKKVHLFTYEHGNLIQKLTMNRSNGSGQVEEGILCSYTPSGLLEKMSTFGADYSERTNTCTWHYDQAGRQVSKRNESFDGTTGTLQYWRFDSVGYNTQGEQIYQCGVDWWSNQTHGYEDRVTSTDTSTVTSSAQWHRGEWVNTWQSIHSGSPESGHEFDRGQSWNGKTWIDDWLGVTTYDAEGRQLRYSGYSRENETWVEGYRASFDYNTSGYIVEEDLWIDAAWKPFWQSRYTTDAMGRTLRFSSLFWNDAWILEYTRTYSYPSDGSVVESDSAYWEGRLYRAGSRSNDASGKVRESDSIWTADGDWAHVYEFRADGAGHVLLEKDLDWNEKRGSWEGWWYKATYTPTGHASEVITETLGLRYTDTRYVLTYDDADRIRSMRVYVKNGDQWSDVAYPGMYNDGSRWTFGSAEPTTYFHDFDELRFGYRTDVSEVSTATGEKPEHSALGQNYPNPFNPTTTIPFSVATGARTTVTIFDVLGREVARPIDEWKDPGEYKVQFDASGLASGMYLCRFTSGSVTDVRKLMLVR